jgi:hypothetical protein
VNADDGFADSREGRGAVVTFETIIDGQYDPWTQTYNRNVTSGNGS